MNTLNNQQAWLALSYFSKISPVRLSRLEKHCGSARNIFIAPAQKLISGGLTEKLVSEFVSWQLNFDIKKIESELVQLNIQIVTIEDKDYPPLLKEIYGAPPVIFYRGNLKLLKDCSRYGLSVVGSREHGAYGRKIIDDLLPQLLKHSLIIISGLALGIDSLAHCCALAYKGSTIAVLGSGLDRRSIYPAANRQLAEDIVKKNGLIISEFPPHTPPLKQNFPRRNRIISGLGRATLVIEADLKSGALITANCALDQNRDVLTIPGNIYSNYSRGTNKLLKLGAKAITEAGDILEIYDMAVNIETKKNNAAPEAHLNTESERIIYRLIKDAHDRGELISAAEITNACNLDTAVINSTLSILELRGVAKYGGIGYDIN